MADEGEVELVSAREEDPDLRQYDFDDNGTGTWGSAGAVIGTARQKLISVEKRWLSLGCKGHVAIILAILVVAFAVGLTTVIGVSHGVANTFYDMGYDEGINKYEGGNYVYRYSWDYEFNRTNPVEAVLLNSNEYQIKLNKTVYNGTQAREDEIVRLHTAIQDFLGLSNDDLEKEWAVYRERQYDRHNCGDFKYSEIRTRDFYHGSSDRETTVSINKDFGHDKDEAAALDLRPADEYLDDDDDAKQKVEMDVHPCFYKYCRETKLKHMPHEYRIKNCSQLHQLFPYAPGFADAPANATLSARASDAWVFEYTLDGTLWYDTTKFKVLWTLYYHKKEEALSGDACPTKESELSFRFYSMGKGMATFEHDVLVYAGQLYQFLLDDIGDKHLPCDDDSE